MKSDRLRLAVAICLCHKIFLLPDELKVVRGNLAKNSGEITVYYFGVWLIKSEPLSHIEYHKKVENLILQIAYLYKNNCIVAKGFSCNKSQPLSHIRYQKKVEKLILMIACWCKNNCIVAKGLCNNCVTRRCTTLPNHHHCHRYCYKQDAELLQSALIFKWFSLQIKKGNRNLVEKSYQVIVCYTGIAHIKSHMGH